MADLRWLVAGSSGESFKMSSQSFLRRLTGKPRHDTRRSRSADPPQRVKKQILAQHLSMLRAEIEEKTQRLNDGNFEVTEEWLFEFAGQHAEYMEKATSRAGSSHEFRSTTDLFQHVLQHPTVLKCIGAAGSAKSSSVGNGECLPGGQQVAEEASKGSDESGDVAAITPEPSPEHRGESSPSPANASADDATAPTEPLRKRWSMPSVLPPDQDGSARQRRASTSALTSREDGGELAQKMRQRAKKATWHGLSPRSQRLRAASAAEENRPAGSEEASSSAANISARRKLLETSLSSCGFQKAATAGA